MLIYVFYSPSAMIIYKVGALYLRVVCNLESSLTRVKAHPCVGEGVRIIAA